MTELGGSVTQRAQLRKNACALRTRTPGAAYQMGLSQDPSLLPATFKNGKLTQGLAYLSGIDRRAAVALHREAGAHRPPARREPDSPEDLAERLGCPS